MPLSSATKVTTTSITTTPGSTTSPTTTEPPLQCSDCLFGECYVLVDTSVRCQCFLTDKNSAFAGETCRERNFAFSYSHVF